MRIGARQSIKMLRSQKAGKIIGYLFLAIGLGALIHLAKITIDEKAARNWVPHNAQIVSANLTTHVNDKGGKTYSIDVTYEFEWQGSTVKGTRFRLHDKASANLSESDNVVQGLLLSKRNGQHYPIFVNPDNPRQSAIQNTVHPKAKTSSRFLGLLFSIIGFYTAFKPKLLGRRAISGKGKQN